MAIRNLEPEDDEDAAPYAILGDEELMRFLISCGHTALHAVERYAIVEAMQAERERGNG